MLLSQHQMQGLRSPRARQHRYPRQVWKGKKPRPSILPHLWQAFCLYTNQRVVWFAYSSRDDQTNHPTCCRRRWCQGNREIAWPRQGHRQPGDPSCWRTLRSRAFKPADIAGAQGDPARRAVDLCKKKKSSGSQEDLECQYGRTWIWTAIDAPTRLLITFWIGGRELEDARQMLKDLTGRVQGKPLFVSDELSHYGTVLAELFHKLVPAPLTGKRGRPRNPERVVDADLDYATVHKTRQDGRVIKVECKVVHGNNQRIGARLADSPSCTINTAYIERSNLDWRLWDAHLARKSPTAARSMRWLKAKFAICVACYNFIRAHETLSRGKDRIFRPITPAMAANVTDRPWTFNELLAYPTACQ